MVFNLQPIEQYAPLSLQNLQRHLVVDQNTRRLTGPATASASTYIYTRGSDNHDIDYSELDDSVSSSDAD